MKKELRRIATYLLMTLAFVAFVGCGKSGGGSNIGRDVDKYIARGKYKITRFTFVSAVENKDNIWSLNWPVNYEVDNYSVNFFDPKEMTKEQRDYIYSFVDSLPNYQGEEEYLCTIKLSLEVGNGNKIITGTPLKVISGSYPEGYDEFASIVNDLCGGNKEYVSTSTKMLEATPELFTIRTNISDINVYGGTVEDLMSFLNIDSICDLNEYSSGNGSFTVKDCASHFTFVKYLANELKSAPSTDEECYAYAVELAGKLGVDESLVVKEVSEYGEQEWYSIPDYEGYNLRVYRTDQIQDKIMYYGGYVDSYYDTFKIYESTMSPYDELQGYKLYDFTYSPDDKFAVAVDAVMYEDKDIFAPIGAAMEDY